MGNELTGKHIVLGASRKTEEMTLLIEKQGGKASVRSLQGTVKKAGKELENDLKLFADHGADWVILTTGIGLETLLEQAEVLGIKEAVIQQLKNADIAARGYKTTAALKRLSVKAVVSDDDGTTQGLIRQLQNFDFDGKKVVVQLHGEKAPSLIRFLESKGAVTSQLLPYQHIAPSQETLEILCKEILQGSVDAVCFTTAIQVHFLFDYVREHGYEEQINAAFSNKTVATAVGKVTAAALKEEGVKRIVVPKLERMGAMIIELANYYKSQTFN